MNQQLAIISEISKNTINQQGLSFLREVDKYIGIIRSDDYFSKVLDSMYDSYERESIEILKANNRSISDFDIHIRNHELSEKIHDQYPIYSWKQLLHAQEDYQLVKQYETEDDIPDVAVTIPEHETELGLLYESQINLKSIPLSVVNHGYKEHFSRFSKAFSKLIVDIERKGGLFSKYFDYNPDSGILYFQGSEIQINERKKITNANHLLTFLFANEPFEQHFYSELEEHEALLEPKHWSSYHKACIDIQNKVLAKTDVSDFLDFNSGPKMYVRINPVYSTYKATS